MSLLNNISLQLSRKKGKWNLKYEESVIKQTFLELILYILFLITVCIVAFGLSGTTMYYLTKMLGELLLEKGFTNEHGFELNFESMTLVEEFWIFTDEILVNGLYGYDSQEKDEEYYILGENKLIGPVRMRQVRVKNDSCSIHPLFHRHFNECFGSYSDDNEDYTSFGLRNGSEWYYHSDSKLGGSITWGILKTYKGGGYYVDFKYDRDVIKKLLKHLKANNWIDRGTRAIIIEFTIYNVNSNLFCISKLIIETPPAGGIITSYNFRTAKLLRFVSTLDYFVFACQIFYFLQLLWYTGEEIYELYIVRWRYFFSVQNWVDMSIIMISYFSLSFSIVRYIFIKEKLNEYNSTKNEIFINFDYLSFWQMQENNLMAICVFLVWVKIMKFISFNHTMLQFSTTLSRCAFDLLGFGVMFFIIFLAFAHLGYMLFGTDNSDFRTFTDSIFTLLKIILGDFDYIAMERSNRILGPIYFLSFIFLAFFVLLNMFLAIINDTYGEIKSEKFEDNIHLGIFFKKKYNKFIKFIKLNSNYLINVKSPNDDDEQNIIQKKRFRSSYDINMENEKNVREIFENARDMYKDELFVINERIDNIELTLDDIIYKIDSLINRLESNNREGEGGGGVDVEEIN